MKFSHLSTSCSIMHFDDGAMRNFAFPSEYKITKDIAKRHHVIKSENFFILTLKANFSLHRSSLIDLNI